MEFARKLLHANSDNISPNPTMPALESVLRTLTSMKMFALLPVFQVILITELVDVFLLFHKLDVLILTS